MALPGELRGLNGATCTCGKHLVLEVCSSYAGYYLGYKCNECGPYSRETGYFETMQNADAAISAYRTEKKIPFNIRDTDFHG